MDLIRMLHKLSVVIERANEFIDANIDRMLPDEKTKMIDICTISLMQFEDHVFHWDQLKNIVAILVEKRITGTSAWRLDIDKSTSDKIVVKSCADGIDYILPVETFMLSAQLAAH